MPEFPYADKPVQGSASPLSAGGSNPYSAFASSPGGGRGGVGGGVGMSATGEVPSGPERMSFLAIASLATGLVCCLPLVPLLGFFLGVLSLWFIGRSNGRLSGKGLAIAGIVLGLLFTALQVGALIGGQQVISVFVRSGTQAVQPIDQGDIKGTRDLLTPGASALLTDDEIRDFSARIKARFGAFKGSPQGLWEFLTNYSKFGQAMTVLQTQAGRSGQNKAGPGDPVPLIFRFDNGLVFVALVIDPAGRSSSSSPFAGTLSNIGFSDEQGNFDWLVPLGAHGAGSTLPAPGAPALPSGSGTPGTPPGTPSGTPSTPAAPDKPAGG